VPEILEVEVIAIDGAPPPPPRSPEKEKPRPMGMPDWRQLGAKLMKLDRRWWPLWVLLGLVVLSLVVVVGLFVAAAIVVAGLLRAFVRIITGGTGSPGFNATIRRRG